MRREKIHITPSNTYTPLGIPDCGIPRQSRSSLWAARACRGLPPESTLARQQGHHTVYCGAVGRTQIYLGDDELELLDRVAQTTGASRSELVRRAVRNTYGEKTKAERLRALEASAGAFRGRRMTGADYVDALRGDLNERLDRQGIG